MVNYLNIQKMYDSETDFNLLMTKDRLSKFLVHYEAFKKVAHLNGSIVEAGVFKGTSFSRFAMMRKLFNKENSKLIGFDVFEEPYPDTKYKNEKKQRKHWMKTAGNSFSKKKLETLFKKKNIKNFQLIKGNVLKTVPEFLNKRPKEKIILLNVDIDFVESTECVLNHFYPRIIKGGLILLDNYQVQMGHTFYHIHEHHLVFCNHTATFYFFQEPFFLYFHISQYY